MKITLRSVSLLSVPVVGFLLLTGCSTPAAYVETGSSRMVVNVGQVNIQDFNSAADAMVNSLIDNFINQGQCKSGVAGEPALMAISKIVNNTSKQLDTDLLVKKIRIALNRTGKIQTTTTMGLGAAEDPLAADQQKAQEFFEDKKHARLPDYTLSGKIIELRAKDGSTRQSTFSFQLSLTSRSGIAVWEDAKEITKQGSTSSVGF
ncbi:MAG: penicillin-binding protein activator LpoB [bacterium]